MSGVADSREETARISSEIGDTDTAKVAGKPEFVVGPRAQREIINAARIEAQDWVREIEGRCRKVLLNVHGADEYNRETIARQLGGVIRDYLEDAEPGQQFAARRRPMKIRNKAQHREYQRTRLPYIEYIRSGRVIDDAIAGEERRAKDQGLTAAQRRAAAKRAKQLKASKEGQGAVEARPKRQHQNTRMRTGWNRWYNRGVVAKANEIEQVAYLQWTTKRDGRVCPICEPYDLLVVPKNSPRVATHSPPLHYRCRCRWLHVTREQSKKFEIKPTPKRDQPDFDGDDMPASGFGG